jgi:GPI mannosyltransferase 3
VLVAFAAAWGGSRLPPLLLVSLAVYATHSLIGHKEYRFVSPATPLVMTLAGIGSVFAMHSVAKLARRPRLRNAALASVPVLWVAISAILATRAPAAWLWTRERGAILAMRTINADPASCGVGIVPDGTWYTTGGYVHLRPGLRLYVLGDPSNLDAFNYAIVYRGGIIAASAMPDRPRADYVPIQCWQDPVNAMERDEICLLRRPGGCDPAATWPFVAPASMGN